MPNPTGYETARKIRGPDKAMMLAGLAVFIGSFLPWYGFSYGFFSASADAWQVQPVDYIAVLLASAVAVAVLVRTFSEYRLPSVRTVGPNLLLAMASGLATGMIVIGAITLPVPAGADTGPQAGLFLGLAAAITQAACATRAYRSSGERAPRLRDF
jgi:hypothetical protein